MANGVFNIPYPATEEVLSFEPDSTERKNLQAKYNEMFNQAPIDVPMYIGNKEVTTNDKRPMSPPHDHQKILGHFNYGDASHVNDAIDSALAARPKWAAMPWHQRAAIFL
ncbi:MAG: aldehyde dehydrogenase family protein, partial [Flavobacteriales bacterium]|nr:aldehyde dehydrogenase family protein [Flavobacteriales bacterium]